MKVLTSLKNSVLSALSVLEQPSLPLQLHIKDISFRPIDVQEECGRQAESNAQDNIEDTTRPSKRPRISVPEPARYNASIEAKLFRMLHRALGLREVADLRDLSQIAQMKPWVYIFFSAWISVLTAVASDFYNHLKMTIFKLSLSLVS